MSEPSNKINRVYLIIFFGFLFILTLLPMYFYRAKLTKNPKEFRTQEKYFATIEVAAYNISPSIASFVKVGDIQKDYNGEENARIVSVNKIVPSVMASCVYDGKDIDFVTGRNDVYLTLEVRYGKVGDDLFLYPGVIDLRAGNGFTLKFREYALTVEITKVHEKNDKDSKNNNAA